MERLRSRIRIWTLFFMAGLLLSGATALPITTELEVGVAVLGEEMNYDGLLPRSISTWLVSIRDGIRATSAQAPFMFYGTDWLAFGHFVIALAFLGALRDPVRNRWLYEFGMMTCALVPVWALVFGHLRGIPLWWRAIDSAFGLLGFVPVWLCHRWSGELMQAEAVERSKHA